MHKLAIATALATALIVPTFAVAVTDSETQAVNLTVSKALEGTAADAVSISGAPSGSSNVNLDSGQVAAVNLRSNAAWTGSISAASATMSENDSRESGSLSNALLYGSTSTPSSTMPLSATQVSTGSRNQNNDAQAYSLYFRQPISWADEAGDYSLTVTHSLAN